jgi:hypothetical protein
MSQGYYLYQARAALAQRVAIAMKDDKPPDSIYFVSENHALWVWSETVALPVMVLSFARSNGVLDDWSIENYRSGYPPRTVHGKPCWYELPCFQNPSFNSSPLLHHSNTPGPLRGGSKQSHVLWAWILYLISLHC